ncbi:LysR family transcriptional regulator [Mesorhizobium sp. SP-1A]|uniref:LysR family transcriptional regulator n=1 Tax=Mesorhizobium sp. SP-1A TaxID=3077840 RepID=UPI0028F734A3|nr:LysR family transcriptional regulator [Mesorhizobium sp. SP-1A]
MLPAFVQGTGVLKSEDKQIDTRQLRILLTLIEERSVTRAAEILNQSQPYVSLVLKRLRELVDDPLLVRSGSKLVPTDRARSMVEPIRTALAGIEQVVSRAKAFDPAEATGTFHIASADCMEAFFLPRLIAQVRSAAPGVRLMIRSIEQGYDYAAALEKGELDAVIGNWPSPPQNLKTVHLMADDIVCLMGGQHPLASETAIAMETYLEAEHLAPVPMSSADPGPIDGRLAELGLKRDIRVMVPEFNLVPYVLLSSDLIFTSSRHFAQHYSAFLPIRTVDAPGEFGKMRFYLLWHECAHAAPENSWLRSQIIGVSRMLGSRPAAAV